MAIKKQEIGQIKFWSPLRIVSTVIVLGLVAAFGVASCNSHDPAPTASIHNPVTQESPSRSFGTLPGERLLAS